MSEEADKPKEMLWQEWGLQLTPKGEPLSNLRNAVTVLESAPQFKGRVWYDEFLQRIVTLNGGAKAREWHDADDISTALFMQSELGITRIGRDLVNQAVISTSHQNKRNCVRDWMDSLTYDGTKRIDHFFCDFMGVADSEYVFAAARNFWLSLIARAYQPGCKVDNMIVLEGSQGVGKSTALQIIGGEWFAEQHESATNPKGFAEILQGKLLIEISEMDSFNRAEVNRVKQTVSCPSDRFRASYGRYAIDHPRTCIFVGTTNRDDWNRDETGARRFWPIACSGAIDLEGIRNAREQLFAEAVTRHKAGEAHWQMPLEETRVEQEARYQHDPWLERVKEILKGKSEVTTAKIMEEMGLELIKRGRPEQMRVGQCLRFLGWPKHRATTSGSREYVYFAPKVGQVGQVGQKELKPFQDDV